MFRSLLASAALVASVGAADAASVVFFEDFDGASFARINTPNGGAPLDQFTVVDGAVDDFTDGGFNLACPSLGCLDLDGSIRDAGRIESVGFGTLAGASYLLEFNISGNQRFGAGDALSFGVIGGTSASLTRAPSDPFGVVSLAFLASGSSTQVFFDHAGGDDFGIILDFVRVSERDVIAPIPVPAALPMLAIALAGFGAVARRRRARD